MASGRAVWRFILRNLRRIGVTIAGFLLLLAGLVMLVTPGPGWAAIFAGLGLLATEYVWARRALDKAKARARQAYRRVRRPKGARPGDPPRRPVEGPEPEHPSA